MTRAKTKNQYEPGRGYTREDWDSVDSPELSDEELAQMKPAREILPQEFFNAIEELRRSRGRPPVETPKKQITLRLDQDVIEKFRGTGRGWQSRMNEALKRAKI
jgi:uncharacterized protein (DUF4415 family)